jgi:hypothetical protein
VIFIDRYARPVERAPSRRAAFTIWRVNLDDNNDRPGTGRFDENGHSYLPLQTSAPYHDGRWLRPSQTTTATVGVRLQTSIGGSLLERLGCQLAVARLRRSVLPYLGRCGLSGFWTVARFLLVRRAALVGAVPRGLNFDRFDREGGLSSWPLRAGRFLGSRSLRVFDPAVFPDQTLILAFSSPGAKPFLTEIAPYKCP